MPYCPPPRLGSAPEAASYCSRDGADKLHNVLLRVRGELCAAKAVAEGEDASMPQLEPIQNLFLHVSAIVTEKRPAYRAEVASNLEALMDFDEELVEVAANAATDFPLRVCATTTLLLLRIFICAALVLLSLQNGPFPKGKAKMEAEAAKRKLRDVKADIESATGVSVLFSVGATRVCKDLQELIAVDRWKPMARHLWRQSVTASMEPGYGFCPRWERQVQKISALQGRSGSPRRVFRVDKRYQSRPHISMQFPFGTFESLLYEQGNSYVMGLCGQLVPLFRLDGSESCSEHISACLISVLRENSDLLRAVTGLAEDAVRDAFMTEACAEQLHGMLMEVGPPPVGQEGEPKPGLAPGVVAQVCVRALLAAYGCAAAEAASTSSVSCQVVLSKCIDHLLSQYEEVTGLKDRSDELVQLLSFVTLMMMMMMTARLDMPIDRRQDRVAALLSLDEFLFMVAECAAREKIPEFLTMIQEYEPEIEARE